jgi:hypothetical protein
VGFQVPSPASELEGNIRLEGIGMYLCCSPQQDRAHQIDLMEAGRTQYADETPGSVSADQQTDTENPDTENSDTEAEVIDEPGFVGRLMTDGDFYGDVRSEPIARAGTELSHVPDSPEPSAGPEDVQATGCSRSVSPCGRMNQAEQFLYARIVRAVSAMAYSVEKNETKWADAFSCIAKWLMESSYAAWHSTQLIRALLINKPNSTIIGTAGYTIGPESIDASGCLGIVAAALSMFDTRSAHVGFENARVDLKNAEAGKIGYLIAQTTAAFITRLIDDVHRELSFSATFRKRLTDELGGLRDAAEKKAFTAKKAIGSFSEKEKAYLARLFGGFPRDVVIQPVQGVNNTTLFCLKSAALSGAGTKEVVGPAVAALSKVGAALSLAGGTCQLIQGAIDSDTAIKKSRRISDAKKRYRTALRNMRSQQRGSAAATNLMEQIYTHCEAERKNVRWSNRLDRAGGITRINYGALLIVVGILTLALPVIGPILAMTSLILSASYLGWTAVRSALSRHRKKRIDKEKARIQHEYDLIMKFEKPKSETSEDMKLFWRNERFLQNRLFALHAAAHYSIDAQEAGLEEDREVLEDFLADMGVPAGSLVNHKTLFDNLKFHLLEDGAFKPGEESLVQWAVDMLGKDDLAGKQRGMNFLLGRVDGSDTDRKAMQESAIRQAFLASTRTARKESACKLVALFKEKPREPRVRGNPVSPRASQPRAEWKPKQFEYDELIAFPPALTAYANDLKTRGREADGKAAYVLFDKLRGYSVEGVMKSLKCFSGSWFSRGVQFDRVAQSVARIALEERLSLSGNGDLTGDRHKAIAGFCAYAAQQEGMVRPGFFNHRVHPDFENLISAVDGLCKNDEKSRWLVKAIEQWSRVDDREGGRKFRDAMELALVAGKDASPGQELVKALQRDRESASTALKWLLPMKPDLADAGGGVQRIVSGLDSAANAVVPGAGERQAREKDLAQYIDYKLGRRQWVEGTCQWLGFDTVETPLQSLARKFDGLNTLDEAVGVLADVLADAPIRADEVKELLQMIRRLTGQEEENEDWIPRIGWYISVRRKLRQDAGRKKFSASEIEQRIAANRNFIADDLAMACKRPDLVRNHPITADFLGSLKKPGPMASGMAKQFLRRHYALETRSSGQGKEKLAELLQMAEKLGEWTEHQPLIKAVHNCLRSTDVGLGLAATVYLSQLGFSSSQVKKMRMLETPQEFNNELCEVINASQSPRQLLGESGTAFRDPQPWGLAA